MKARPYAAETGEVLVLSLVSNGTLFVQCKGAGRDAVALILTHQQARDLAFNLLFDLGRYRDAQECDQ